MATAEQRLSTALWDWIEAEGVTDEPAEELHIELMGLVLGRTAAATREVTEWD